MCTEGGNVAACLEGSQQRVETTMRIDHTHKGVWLLSWLH